MQRCGCHWMQSFIGSSIQHNNNLCHCWGLMTGHFQHPVWLLGQLHGVRNACCRWRVLSCSGDTATERFLPAPVFTRNSGSGNVPIVCAEIDGWRCLLLLGRFCISWIWMECLASALVRPLDERYQRQTIMYKSEKRLYGNKRAMLMCVLQNKTNG